MTTDSIRQRELVASLMMRCGMATGHGDTIEDLLLELEPQIQELRTALVVAREFIATNPRDWVKDELAAIDAALAQLKAES